MAYLTDLPRCRACSTRVAVVALYNNRNALIGAYCRQHGNRALKAQQVHEQRAGTEALADLARQRAASPSPQDDPHTSAAARPTDAQPPKRPT